MPLFDDSAFLALTQPLKDSRKSTIPIYNSTKQPTQAQQQPPGQLPLLDLFAATSLAA